MPHVSAMCMGANRYVHVHPSAPFSTSALMLEILRTTSIGREGNLENHYPNLFLQVNKGSSCPAKCKYGMLSWGTLSSAHLVLGCHALDGGLGRRDVKDGVRTLSAQPFTHLEGGGK